MESLPQFATYILEASYQLKYFLLFLGIIIEGPVLMVVCGFLLRLEVFAFWPMYVVIMLGDLTGDVIWYYVGHFFAEPFLRKFGKYFGVNKENLELAKDLFQKHHFRILFISKITLGLGAPLATLISAGASHVPFRKYMKINLFGEMFLVLGLVGIGYFFGHIYSSISGDLKTIFLIALAILVPVGVFFLRKHFKQNKV
ncbi:MAG: DedA family protein [Candidatus Peregrinibacteria bacterium]|nr:DedA family protein [Candidatus Peregrinibacteria bacterium]